MELNIYNFFMSFYCKNSKPLSITKKSSIVRTRLGSKHAFAF